MSDVNLELLALRWLKWERRCMIVLRERSPRETICGRPDVLGITRARFMIEIEIKRSMADFRADGKKDARRRREQNGLEPLFPRQFYYFTPRKLAETIGPMIPPWAGLMTVSEYDGPLVLRVAPSNHASKRLTIKECVQLAYLQSNYIVSLEEAREAQRNTFRQGHQPWDWTYAI